MTKNQKHVFFAFLISLTASYAMPSAAATITTDKTDYAPGEQVTFTGSGWQPGETITITLSEEPALDEHGPFTAVANDDGNFINSDFTTNDQDVAVTFTATATGSASGSVAQTTFTDAGPTVSVNITAPTTSSPFHIGSLPAIVNISFRYSVLNASTAQATAFVRCSDANFSNVLNPLPNGANLNASIDVLVDSANNGTCDVQVKVDAQRSKVDTQPSAVQICLLPAITTDPSGATACAGSSVTFSVSATSAAPLSYQWRKNGANISGATGSTYTINSVAVEDAGSYDVVVSNACGSATSSAATLTVKSAPTITMQPASITRCATTDSATFAVTATGSDLSYQWRKGGVAIASATGSSFTIASVTPSDAGSYDVVVSNTCGSRISDAATLTVNTAPVVTSNPASITICAGTSASFTAFANGTPAPAVQWQVTSEGLSFTDIAGATTSTLTFTATAGDDTKQYRAVFINACNSATSSAATLNVHTAPVITTNPAAATICAGTQVTFTAAASGTNPTVQWEVSLDGAFTPISGANSLTLTITASNADDGKQFHAVFTNECGTATTGAATLTVHTAPVVTANPIPVTICAGSPVSFTAAASGTNPTVQWQVNSGSGFNDIAGANSPTLSFTPSVSDNGNSYRAVFSNECGTATSAAATLTVHTPVAITSSPDSYTAVYGETHTFTASASGNPAPTVQWELSLDNGAHWSPLNGQTAASLTVGPVVMTQTGTQYHAVFTNSCNSATTAAAVLTVIKANSTTIVNCAPAAYFGDTVTLTANVSVVAPGSGNPTGTVEFFEGTTSLGTASVSGGSASITDSTFLAGTHAITAKYSGDGNFNGSASASPCSQVINPKPAVTTVSVMPTAQQYSDVVTIVTTIAPVSINGHSPATTVTLSIGTQTVATALPLVLADGVLQATWTGALLQAPAIYTVTASFGGIDPNFVVNNATATLNITQEDARATYTGTLYASVGSSNSATITLSATIQDITAVDPASDPNGGDIRNASVSFVDRDNSNALLCSAPVGLVSTDTKTGTVTCNYTVTLNGNQTDQTLHIGTIVGNYYIDNNAAEDAMAEVTRNGTGYITGGGYLVLSNSSGQFAGDSGSKNNFGFNVANNKSGTNFQGHLNTIIRSGGRVYQVKTTAINSLFTNSGFATYSAKASIQDITDPANPLPIDGNASLKVDMHDLGDGPSDTIAITIWNKNGGLWYSSNWSGTQTLEQGLGGGNLQVH